MVALGTNILSFLPNS